MGTKVGSLPGGPSLVHGVALFPVVGGAGKGVCGKESCGGQNKESLVSDRQTHLCCLALGIFEHLDVLRDIRSSFVVLAHLKGERYHIHCV